MKKGIFTAFFASFFIMVMSLPVGADSGVQSQTLKVSNAKPVCKKGNTTICTLEMWLEHKHKKNNRAIRKVLKDKTIKVLHHTIQYWKPKGGHPPTNIAIGRGLSAEDARWVIDLALEYNDRVNGLIFQSLNPPNYVAIATSAWDEDSETPITPEQLAQLRDPKLSTQEFHALYVSLTNEKNIPGKFY
ncbi:MAG: hypothetical protein ACQ9MH_00910 [Nitrospinales bacterium]